MNLSQQTLIQTMFLFEVIAGSKRPLRSSWCHCTFGSRHPADKSWVHHQRHAPQQNWGTTMQVVILLIELHNNLLHPRCFTFILHNLSYFIQSNRRVVRVGHKVLTANWKYPNPGSPGPGTVQLHHRVAQLEEAHDSVPSEWLHLVSMASLSGFLNLQPARVFCQFSSCSFGPNEESDTDGKMMAGIA